MTGCITLSIFVGVFFDEEFFPILDQLRPEQGEGPKGELQCSKFNVYQ